MNAIQIEYIWLREKGPSEPGLSADYKPLELDQSRIFVSSRELEIHHTYHYLPCSESISDAIGLYCQSMRLHVTNVDTSSAFVTPLYHESQLIR